MAYPNCHLENKLIKQGHRLIAGVDEVGRGALAGPIVAAAVIMPKKKIAGLKDSKLLSPAKRQALSSLIKKTAVGYSLAAISQELIDKMGITWANRQVIQKAVAKLKPKPNYVLIDGNLKISTKIPYQSIIDGDYKIYSIAAASILAKVYRDNLLVKYHKKFPAYHFDWHKGYGTRKHLKKIKEFGPCRLHRQTFIKNL